MYIKYNLTNANQTENLPSRIMNAVSANFVIVEYPLE
jgi:hypothetical protein